ncbi:MAG TPA: hypothetical protein VLL27_11580 [Solirubrobacterales bacterium]|nr:hypothetical protein [Solirubrobacterales bacterium]
MTFKRKIVVGLAVIALLVSFGILAGCGSDSSNSSSNTSERTTEPAGTTAPSAEFVGKTGNNTPGSFGKVATESEREAASKVLEANLIARAAGDWPAQCASLTAQKKIQSGIFAAGGKGCANGLKAQAEPLSRTEDVRANTMTGPIVVLRVKGKLGYALYHGKGSQDYAMLMKKEDGQWRVAHLATNEIP